MDIKDVVKCSRRRRKGKPSTCACFHVGWLPRPRGHRAEGEGAPLMGRRGGDAAAAGGAARPPPLKTALGGPIEEVQAGLRSGVPTGARLIPRACTTATAVRDGGWLWTGTTRNEQPEASRGGAANAVSGGACRDA